MSDPLETWLLVASGSFSDRVMLVRAEDEREARHLADVKRGKVCEWRVLRLTDLGPLAVYVGLDDPAGLDVLLG